MGAIIRFLAENGGMLAAGVTALLGLGCVAAALCRSPVHRQRVCEGAVVGALVWAILACIPLPRMAVEKMRPAEAPPAVRVVEVREIPPELIASPNARTIVPDRLTTDPSLPAARPRVPVGDWVAIGFVSGVVACGAWLVVGQIVLMRIVRRAVDAPADVRARVEEWAGGRRVRVVVSAGVGGPVTWGAWRAVIVLPAELLGVGREVQLRQVLLHEAGHVRQGDGLGNLLFCLALPVLYFHPLYWWLRRSSDLARELVADDWAARADGKDAYVTELVSLARARIGTGMAGAIGMVRRRSHFYRRMRMLLQRSEPLATGCSTGWRVAMGVLVTTGVMGAAAVVGVRPAVAQDRPAEVKEPVAPPAVDAKPVDAGAEQKALRDAEKRLAMLMERQRQLMAELTKSKSDVEALTKRLKQNEFEGQRADPNAARGGGGGGGNAASVGGVQLDLVNLANSLVDASGAFKQAKIAFEERDRMKNTGAVTQSELMEAKARLETAQKRVDLMRAIAAAALESAKVNYARVKQQYQMGLVGAEQYEELAGKVKMLELIVRGAE